jgi:hypothetical protein
MPQKKPFDPAEGFALLKEYRSDLADYAAAKAEDASGRRAHFRRLDVNASRSKLATWLLENAQTLLEQAT